MDSFALMRPREGAVHAPGTVGGAWHFPYDSRWFPILNAAGNPIPYEVGVAAIAERFFTPTDAQGAGECLIDVEIVAGSLEFRAPGEAPTRHRDPDTGQDYATIAELVEAVKARALAGAAPAAPARGPEPEPEPGEPEPVARPRPAYGRKG